MKSGLLVTALCSTELHFLNKYVNISSLFYSFPPFQFTFALTGQHKCLKMIFMMNGKRFTRDLNNIVF